jgi:large subunit ribosomal protein L10
MTALRVLLRKSNVELRVVKNTLLDIASRGTELSVLEGQFRGPLTVAIAHGDEVEATKTLIDFAKKNDKLQIRAGVMGGKSLTPEQLATLAELPSREILLGQLLSVMVAAQTSLVNVLSGVPRNFVQVLNAYKDKKESAN